MVQKLELLIPLCALFVLKRVRKDATDSCGIGLRSVIMVRIEAAVDVRSLVGCIWRRIIHLLVESWVRHQGVLAASCATSLSTDEC